MGTCVSCRVSMPVAAGGPQRPYEPQHSDVYSATDFMKRHACRTMDETYTHSSLQGFRDVHSSSGRFRVGDDHRAQEELARALEVLYLSQDSQAALKPFLTEHPTEA